MYKLLSSKVLLFAILIISFFGMNLEEGKAQCPPGWSQRTFKITIEDCDISYKVCFKCEPHHNNITVYLASIDPAGYPIPCWPLGYTEEDVIAIINDKIQTEHLPDLMEECEIKPCYLGDINSYTSISAQEWLCWEKRNSNGQIEIKPCFNGGHCLVTRKVCWAQNVILYNEVVSKGIITGNQPCTIWIHLPPYNGNFPNPPTINSTSGCFRVRTGCDKK